jgi:hypothetical protein
MNIPGELRAKLFAAGHNWLEVGNIRLHLATNKTTRTISLDGKVVAEPVFPTDEIDWGIVAEAVS